VVFYKETAVITPSLECLVLYKEIVATISLLNTTHSGDRAMTAIYL
jgi:hypothetical protein